MDAHAVLDALLARYGSADGPRRELLLPALTAVQDRFGYLPSETFAAVERRLGVPRQIAYSVASFYDDFHTDRPAEHVIRICDGAACEMGGCRELLSAASEALGIPPGEVTADGCFRLEAVNCLGQCDRCPALRIDGQVLGRVTASELPELLRAVRESGDGAAADWHGRSQRDDHFPAAAPGEQRRVLGPAARSLIDLADWETENGPTVLRRIIGRTAPHEVIQTIKESGLRGFGGAGFPTGTKWQMAAAFPPPRVLVCNADESEPGTFKDRFLLTHRPWLVLEGMVLAAYALSAERGILYLRSDYAYLRPILDNALQALQSAGLLGPRIADSDFSLSIDIRLGAGAYVCGEESALLESIEGGRGEPRLRPPFPVERGVFGRPTVVNNVETLANVARIVDRGPAWFREAGTPTSPGTKLFCVSGDVARPGVYELPLGVPLRTLIDGPAGGVRGQFGFAIVGGAAGTALAAEQLDRPLDFEHQMGNGAVMVFHAGRSPIDVGANLLRFFSRETCGGCLPCRTGVPEACALLESAAGQPLSADQRAAFDSLADCLETTSRCGLGKTALRAARDLVCLRD